jgi:glycosyltransferase involved in cell wall biosynthesis
MKLAIVHDYLSQFGGAERVVLNFHEIFPEAPIFTSIYDKDKLPKEFRGLDIRTSFMQSIPGVYKFFRAFFWIYPFAFYSFNLSEFDVILSSSSAYAKGIRKPVGAKHFCFCYNPMRFVWRYDDYVKAEKWGIFSWLIKKILLPIAFLPLKAWDLYTNRSVDYFITSSRAVVQRIKETYGREAEVINPPIDTNFYYPEDKQIIEKVKAKHNIQGSYFLIVSRLAAYKRVDLAVEAFNGIGKKLVIVGGGPQADNLKNIASKDVLFLGKVSDDDLRALYSGCVALIFPGEEDYGLVPLEAMACGSPVIAYAAGGALETVKAGETGTFFGSQEINAVRSVLNVFDRGTFKSDAIRRHALEYSIDSFTKKMRSFIMSKL